MTIDHGIDVSDNEDPTLWLTIREEDAHIFFEIRDNGAGNDAGESRSDSDLSVLRLWRAKCL